MTGRTTSVQHKILTVRCGPRRLAPAVLRTEQTCIKEMLLGGQIEPRVGRSRKAAGRILQDIGLPWGHQVAVMFQIVCALALEVPSVPMDLGNGHMFNGPL